MFVSVAAPRSPTILHADVDSFFASVEQRDDPRLRGRPTIVGGGVVLAASYEAKACGVEGGMAGPRARRLCPHAIVVEPRFSAYVEASRALFEVFEETAPVVEGLSLEEAFLDVRGLERISGGPLDIGRRLRREVREHLGLPITVGVARTRALAKIASGAGKPDGLLVVPPDRELEFLHPLAVDRIWGVGGSTAGKLRRHGIATVGELARRDESTLISILGPAAGRRLHALANNRDPPQRPARRRRRSFGSQSALHPAVTSPGELDPVLIALVDRVTRRMRAAGRAGRTVVLRLRFGDFSRASRSRSLPRPTASSRTILNAGRALLGDVAGVVARRGLTLLGVTVANLAGERAGAQLELPLERSDGDALDAALDELRRRYGADAVVRAATVGRRESLSAWLLPTDQARGPRRRLRS
jgi:DNA polymerase-4